MIIGYARTSTVEQVAGFDAQLAELKKAGCTDVYKEQVSSVAQRNQLDLALKFVRSGDTLIVTKLDRLARSIKNLTDIIYLLDSKGVTLKILALNLDTSTATGKLMLNMLGSVAEFEREIMLERQKEGIARAKADGKYKGRKPTAKAKSVEVLRLLAEGLKPQEVADKLEMGIASVFRIKKADKEMALATTS